MFARALVRSVATWVAAAAFPVSLASAQITTGTIGGSVRDAQGAIVPGATVTLVSTVRGTTTETQTNSAGDFVFPNVTAGSYLVRVTMDGFKTVERPGVVLSPGDRLLVPTLLIKRARKGGPPVLEAAARALRAGDPAPPAAGSGDTADVARRAAATLKQLALWSLGLAADRYGDALGNEQEVLMLVADLVIDAYAAESAALRAAQAKDAQHPLAQAHADAAAVFASAAVDRAVAGARTVGIAAAGATPADAETAIARLPRLSPFDTIAARRRLARRGVARGGSTRDPVRRHSSATPAR